MNEQLKYGKIDLPKRAYCYTPDHSQQIWALKEEIVKLRQELNELKEIVRSQPTTGV